ncbi:MAG: type IX secretion system membrane protein PorP/SprF [Bacteroidia bacterium]|nr:type IX secretion system membrane protein PorP/SprF [Bacteroidia bacterium]
MRSKHIISILMALCFGKLLAQDPQFTQFYAAPLYLNPAFTGLTYEHRFTANYRNQWTGVKTGYSTLMASYDYNITSLKSGIGGFVLQDRAGTSNLATTMGGVNYAYSAKVNKYSEFRMGLMLAMAQKKLDYTTLIFNDQLITGAAPGSSRDARNVQSINYADVGAGVLYNTNIFWCGASAKHLNKPNTSLSGNVVPTPVSLSVHGGYRFIMSAKGSGKTKIEEFISASANFRQQQKYSQLDIGAYYFKKVFNFGLWYRGLPLKKYKTGYPTRESIAILIGLEIPDKNFRVGYSYDLTISHLGLNTTYGAHELAIVYEIAKKRKRTRRVLVSCPKF